MARPGIMGRDWASPSPWCITPREENFNTYRVGEGSPGTHGEKLVDPLAEGDCHLHFLGCGGRGGVITGENESYVIIVLSITNLFRASTSVLNDLFRLRQACVPERRCDTPYSPYGVVLMIP